MAKKQTKKERPKALQQATISTIQSIAKEKNGKPLTMKQATFIKEYMQTGNASEAGRQAYPNQNDQSAVQQGQKNVQKPTIQNVLAALMDAKGLTDDYLVERLGNGIENGKDQGFNHLKLAFELKGKLTKTNINLSHTIKETRKVYDI